MRYTMGGRPVTLVKTVHYGTFAEALVRDDRTGVIISVNPTRLTEWQNAAPPADAGEVSVDHNPAPNQE